MIANFAEEIYTLSIQLKKYDNKKLMLRKNRLTLEKELYKIQAQVNKIICLLNNNQNYSIEYMKLATFMSNQITECILLLTTKSKNYKNTVSRYVWGYHNLPRAFLSLNNPMRISPTEAMEYYKPYLKLD